MHNFVVGQTQCGLTRYQLLTVLFYISGSFPFFQAFGLAKGELEAILRKSPSLQHVSAELLEARFNSLLSSGISNSAIWPLIAKRPNILIASEVGQFLDFIQDNLKGIDPKKLELLLRTTEPQFLVGFDMKVGLLLKHGIPCEKLVDFVNGISLKVFCCREIDKTERTLIFLSRYGPDLVIQRPRLLNLDLENKLIPRAAFLSALGPEEDCIKIIRLKPVILSYTVKNLEMHVQFWRSVGFSREEIFRLVLAYPGVFSISRERKLQPRTEFLKQCGLNPKDIFKFLTTAPMFLSLSFETNLSKKLSFLVKIGFEYGTKELVMAIGSATRTSSNNMQMLIGAFLDHGLSCEDVFIMIKKHPPVLRQNHKALEKKLQFLAGGVADCPKILAWRFPQFFSFHPEYLEMHIEFLRSIGLSEEEIFRIILSHPSIFSASRERKLQPRIEFLKQCGLDTNDIFKFLMEKPMFLSISFEENLSKKLGFLVKLGYKYRTKDMAMAIGATTMTSCKNVQMAIGVFLDYGLSCEDIFIISKKQPQVLRYNHKYLERKLRYLVEEMGRDVGDLLDFPALRGHKLGERIEPRYEEKIEIGGK
ncbi:hypothetical protein ACLOJK_010003 [Asimina triloba]